MQSHTLIGFDLNTLIIDSARQMGIKSNREHFKIRTDTIMVQNQCAAGLGLVVMQKPLAECIKGMVCVDLSLLPHYLVAKKRVACFKEVTGGV